MAHKAWYKSKRAGVSLAGFWGTTALTVTSAVARCADCTLAQALGQVTAAEAWSILSQFVVCVLVIWYGEDTVRPPGKVFAN